MYTELILGCELKKETPKEVIEVLQLMVNGDFDELKSLHEMPDGYDEEWFYIFRCGSYYFAINEPVCNIRFDRISEAYVLSTRSNLKNYGNEIEGFLEWLLPYIDSGSGAREMYAIVIYEEALEPTIYYLD